MNGSTSMKMNIDLGSALAVTTVSLRKEDPFDKNLKCLEETLIALNVRLFSLRTKKWNHKKVRSWMVTAHTFPTNSQYVVICFCSKAAKLLEKSEDLVFQNLSFERKTNFLPRRKHQQFSKTIVCLSCLKLGR